jgi:hypothetical protein
MPRLCIVCKGSRLLCGRKTCPLLAALKQKTNFAELSKTTEFFGPSTSVFVGRIGYPHVRVGPMALLEGKESDVEIERLEEPSQWFAQGLGMEEIVELRSATLRSKHGENITSRSNFEAWFPGSVWSDAFGQRPVIAEEYEGFKGRKQYVAEEGGGYYAARLAVAEALHTMRRQAGVVVFREIHPRYIIPLGVWVVRETVRAAFRTRGERFDTKKEALDFIDLRLQAKSGMRLRITDFEAQSMILRQKRLTDF